MFRRVEMWVVLLLMLLSAVGTIGFGTLVRQELVGAQKFGMLSKTALFLAEIPLNFKKLFVTIRKTDLFVEDRFPTLGGFDGEAHKNETYLLLSRYDGDIRESVVDLVDLRSFETIHTWNPDITQLNSLIDPSYPEHENLERDGPEDRYRIMHPLLSNDGGLVFQNTSPLIKVDHCGKYQWQLQDDQFHHSVEIDHEGNLWVPIHKFPFDVDEKFVGKSYKNFLDDAITKISPDGELLYQRTISEIFANNNLDYLIHSVGNQKLNDDPIHLNDIQPVLTDGKYWKQGDLFLSLRHQSMIVLYRPSNDKVLWTGTGPFYHQHDVDILDDQRISVFNNNSKNTLVGDRVDGINEVIVYDFESSKYSSYLKEPMKKHDVRTISSGRSQILPDGGLWVEETNYARSLYFNSDGSLRWTHVNRAENQKLYRVNWSRMLYTQRDIDSVKALFSKPDCDDD